MRMYRLGLFSLGLLLVWGSSLTAATKYVVSPAAQLLSEPRASAAKLAKLRKGQSLRQIGASGLYYKVRVAGKVGWVSRLYVSSRRPAGKVSLSQKLTQGAAVRGRRRASSYSETAAARGHGKTETLRTRGSAHEYDFVSVGWAEKFVPTEKELAEFVRAGGLR